ncbi:VanZ family protein [Qipengyuania sp. NPDC077410]|uniref:VanZ family protein n=1 Tax=Qipengyuania sp. NPDC077410 TaxID=3364496 RepID=UPI0037CBC13F
MNRFFLFALGATAFAVLLLANIPVFVTPGNPDDKLLHFAAFAVLAIFAAGALPKVPIRRLWLGLTAFAAAIELVQFLLALGREADWIDFLAGVAGTAAALLIAYLVRRGKSASDHAR